MFLHVNTFIFKKYKSSYSVLSVIDFESLLNNSWQNLVGTLNKLLLNTCEFRTWVRTSSAPLPSIQRTMIYYYIRDS